MTSEIVIRLMIDIIISLWTVLNVMYTVYYISHNCFVLFFILYVTSKQNKKESLGTFGAAKLLTLRGLITKNKLRHFQ